jgi:hypothetical protein
MAQQQKLPKGILPEGIQPPPGTDIMQFCRDLAESGAEFAEHFDRDSEKFHGGNPTPVPLGGARVPESMGGEAAKDWMKLPDAPLAIDEDWGPDYHHAMEAHGQLNKCKKAISVLNKPVEMAMRLRLQYTGAEGEDRTALESRWKGAEAERNGALDAATESILRMSDDDISERTRAVIKEVSDRGRFNFEDKETYGEFVQLLQRANQGIFADQQKLLQRIKDIKKAAKQPVVTEQGLPEKVTAEKTPTPPEWSGA